MFVRTDRNHPLEVVRSQFARLRMNDPGDDVPPKLQAKIQRDVAAAVREAIDERTGGSRIVTVAALLSATREVTNAIRD